MLCAVQFYCGVQSPFTLKHHLADYVALKTYEEIAKDYTPRVTGKVAVGCWVTGLHKNKTKRFSGEVLSLHSPNKGEPYCKVRNVRTGKPRMLPLSLTQKCHSVNAFVKVCLFFD